MAGLLLSTPPSDVEQARADFERGAALYRAGDFRSALAAFEAVDELEANRRTYAENRELLLRELPKAGFERILPADGAFYLYADVSALTADSVELTRQMLAEVG